jgi:hypothetical protein
METNIKIEFVGDINTDYPYLQVFVKDNTNSILDIEITKDKELSFIFYPSKTNIILTAEEWEYILNAAKEFLPKALKNEEDFLNLTDSWD